jgi:uncharacterized protein
MVIAIFFFISVALLSGFYPVAEPAVDEIQLAPGFHPSERHYRQVVPAATLLDRQVVRQSYDYSCGSAALATVLNFQMGETLTERQVITGLLRYGDKKAIIGRRAFSFLDMKRFVEALGYKGVGYSATVADLKELRTPCIVPITVFNYRHFVVFKGIHRGHIFFADPWRGSSSYSLEEFEQIWFRNAIFIVYPKNSAVALNALQLTEEDLRFLDEDAVLDNLLLHAPQWPQARQWELEKALPPEGSVQSKQFDAFRAVDAPAPPESP